MCEPRVGKWGGLGVSVQGLVPSLSATLFLDERRSMMGGGQKYSHPATEGRLLLPGQFGAVLSITGLFWGEEIFSKLGLRSEAGPNGLHNDLESFPSLSFPI